MKTNLINSTSKNTYPKIFLYALITFCLFSMTACSMFGSKSSDKDDINGSSGMTEEELGIGSDSRFGSGNIPTAEARESGPFQDVHFAYDSSSVDSRYHPMLKESAEQLIQDPTLKTEIEGHCDKRGTAEYNLALGEERAKAVSNMLVRYGAKPSQISTISYGEEIPLDPAENEAAYAKNRRVHFALFREK